MTTNNFFMQRNIYACKLTKNCELSNKCRTNDCKFALKHAPKSPSIYIKKKAENQRIFSLSAMSSLQINLIKMEWGQNQSRYTPAIL